MLTKTITLPIAITFIANQYTLKMNHNMGGMDMGGGANMCKISMLWNWYTIDACFLAEGWHIRNNGMFAATCIGVALMTVCLEALRRACREYDVLIAKQWQSHARTITKRMCSNNENTPNLSSLAVQQQAQ